MQRIMLVSCKCGKVQKSVTSKNEPEGKCKCIYCGENINRKKNFVRWVHE